MSCQCYLETMGQSVPHFADDIYSFCYEKSCIHISLQFAPKCPLNEKSLIAPTLI